MLAFPRNSMLITLSAPLIMLIVFWLLLSTLFLSFKPSVKRLLLASVFYSALLNVRDLGGHLDVTLRAVAGTLTNRVKIVLGLVRSKYLPGGLHGCEGAAVSVTALSSFRAAVSRAVWSKKLPMTNTPALLSLLDAPWGSDPAFFIIWNRFRQLRRYLAYRPDDQHRIFRLLDYASAGRSYSSSCSVC